ncbi:hypothetical protein SJI00_20865 [Pseudomonas sp. RP23018S]|uniref:hypothetical protein n=1 Tax=Pseudomonas sp. RP23018S TaxID=3096037 RepID=UPI002ACAF5C2|nr:hypothetical protein [Pseudomonas sp. RP23018S]MDZ5605228.1 hypothetical protein [Pseudomonas sp. RP23018S]
MKIICGLWHEHDRLKPIGMKVLTKANFKCSQCGFVSRSSKRIPHGFMVPVDLNHPGFAASSIDRAICLCPFCAAAKAINWSAVEHPAHHGEILPVAGSLIWLPEMPQAKLNLIATYIAISQNCMDVTHPLFESLHQADLSFRGRKAHLASNIPLYKEDCDSDFARALALLPNELMASRDKVLKGVRFWPNVVYWGPQARYWAQATYKAIEEKNKFFRGV